MASPSSDTLLSSGSDAAVMRLRDCGVRLPSQLTFRASDLGGGTLTVRARMPGEDENDPTTWTAQASSVADGATYTHRLLTDGYAEDWYMQIVGGTGGDRDLWVRSVAFDAAR